MIATLTPVRPARCRRTACVAGLLVVAACGAPKAAEPRGLATAPWRLEAVQFLDGRRLEGLLVDPTAENGVPSDVRRDPAAPIGFVQILQPPGKPVELITWPALSASRVTAIERLPPAERALLVDRVERLRSRRGRQHEAETAVALARDDDEGPWRYSGRWFSLESTADPRLTREAVVRLELVCAAFEALVPPPDPSLAPAPFAVTLCGTAADFRDLKERHGVAGDHPAFYVRGRGRLVAGSDLPALVAQERLAADALSVTEREIAARDRAFEENVRRLAIDLEGQGLPAAKRADAVQLARTRWQRERDALVADVTAARRDNAARVATARREFFARLTHEAWHAHADRRLASPDAKSLPPWLDEGLAQVFESAPLEAGELRLDAADPVRLKALRDLLGSGSPPSLEGMLDAGPSQFLIGHQGGKETSRRHYLLAWGLAFHLAVLEPVLSPEAVIALASHRATGQETADSGSGRTQFERLVGMPLAEFEPAWRRRMLGLKAGASQSDRSRTLSTEP